jgi:tetratricopeptide (TPR) repeat protein
VRRSLVLVAVLVVAGAVVAVVLRRPAGPPPPPSIVTAPVSSPATDAGLSDDEVFAASMARLAEAKRRADAEATARSADASTPPGPAARPDAGGALAALQAAADGGIAPPVKAVLQELARLLADDRYPDAVERVHGLFRQHSDAAVPALELLTVTAQEALRGGGLRRIEPVLRRVEELPTADPAVRASVARLLGTAAVASAKAGQFDRSKLQARAALGLEERTAEAYLALGEYEFQDNDLAGAVDTWERGLRLNPGDVALTRRLERGRAEAERLGGLERVASEHFVAAFDGRADVPAARATLEVLEMAYRKVGGLFELYPDGPIPVVLYPERSFEKEGHASWSAAVYDGKIRLPSAGADLHSFSFQRTLFHEYAHALFHRASGGGRAPTWLNEGFAEVAEVVRGEEILCSPDAHAFPLQKLEGSFQGLNRKGAWFAYLESRHAAERLVKLHGVHGVRSVLAEMSTGSPFPVAFQRALGQDYATFAATFDAEARRDTSAQR